MIREKTKPTYSAVCDACGYEVTLTEKDAQGQEHRWQDYAAKKWGFAKVTIQITHTIDTCIADETILLCPTCLTGRLADAITLDEKARFALFEKWSKSWDNYDQCLRASNNAAEKKLGR